MPEFRLEKFVANGVKTTALLAARFDRANTDDTQLRIPFLSSLSMLGAGEMERRGYMDIAEAIERYSDDSTSDLRELWRRMVFNILITNTDDHLQPRFSAFSQRLAALPPLRPGILAGVGNIC